MGKRIPLEIVYKPTKAVSMKRLVPSVSTKRLGGNDPIYPTTLMGQLEAELVLAHKRAVKAAQMRRWRAKGKAKRNAKS